MHCPYLTNPRNCFQHSNVSETGLSDSHLLPIGFRILPPNIVNYRDYKNFDNEKFRSVVSKFDFGASYLEDFKNATFCSFNEHALIKRKYIRAYEAPFMTKELHKINLKRSKSIYRNAYTSQRNFCEKL